MTARHVTLLLLAALVLPGCDKVKSAMNGGAADPKTLDAEAVGYACRVSQKAPEACMKENEAQSPSAVLSGWKKADTDIKGGTIDPTMSNVVPVAASAPIEANAEAEDSKDEKATEAKSDDKSGKHDKPATDEKTDKAGKSGADKNEHPDEPKGKPASKSH